MKGTAKGRADGPEVLKTPSAHPPAYRSDGCLLSKVASPFAGHEQQAPEVPGRI
jgi:hypothetical protein